MIRQCLVCLEDWSQGKGDFCILGVFHFRVFYFSIKNQAPLGAGASSDGTVGGSNGK